MSIFGNLLGSKKQTSVAGATSLLELITSTAALASNPRDIDVLLDQVRLITSNLQPGQEPTETEQVTLFRVYLKLEEYLTTKEPLRAFTKEQLRSRLSDSLRQQFVTLQTKG